MVKCAPRASNGPNHLGLCALQFNWATPVWVSVFFLDDEVEEPWAEQWDRVPIRFEVNSTDFLYDDYPLQPVRLAIEDDDMLSTVEFCTVHQADVSSPGTPFGPPLECHIVEGNDFNYTVTLRSAPTHPVRVTIVNPSPTDLELLTNSSFEFDEHNWRTRFLVHFNVINDAIKEDTEVWNVVHDVQVSRGLQLQPLRITPAAAVG